MKRKNLRTGVFKRVQYEVRNKIEKLLTRGKMSYASKDGWVKLHRIFTDNPLYFAEEFTRAQAWMDLVLLANHKDGSAWVRGHEIPLKRGQLAYAIKTLSHRWKWSQGKVGRFLEYLKNGDQIEYDKNSLTTIINIKNYDKYQAEETTNGDQTGSKRRSNGDQTETNKNDKNDKNNIYRDFLTLFIDHSGKSIRVLDKKTKGQINARLEEGYTMADFEAAIKNCKADRYHIENPHYLTPEFITRADKLQKYLTAATNSKEAITDERLGKMIFG